MTERRFLPPWTIDMMNNVRFIVRDATGQALAYVYIEDERTSGLLVGPNPCAP